MDLRTATLIHRELRENRLVEIYDQGEVRSLYFGGRFLQSSLSLSTPHLLELSYTHYMMFPLMFKTSLEHVLVIGLGAGSLVHFLHHHFPNCLIDAVDHSSHVIDLARGYFRLPENRKVHIYCEDGFKFLSGHPETRSYDLILVDAFDENGMSTDIYAEPFFRLCADALRPDGVFCCNLWSGNSTNISDIQDELGRCFSARYFLPVPDRGNLICTAVQFELQWRIFFRNRGELQQLQRRFKFDFSRVTEVAKRNNLSLAERLLHIFTG